MGRFLETKVADIEDAEILSLIEELEAACHVGSPQFLNAPLFHFLTQCVYPEGPGRRLKITTQSAASAPLLESRVGNLPDGALRKLCSELALRANQALEFFSGNKIYVFLNKTLPEFSVKKPTAKQRRWDTVVNQRRSNRR